MVILAIGPTGALASAARPVAPVRIEGGAEGLDRLIGHVEVAHEARGEGRPDGEPEETSERRPIAPAHGLSVGTRDDGRVGPSDRAGLNGRARPSDRVGLSGRAGLIARVGGPVLAIGGVGRRPDGSLAGAPKGAQAAVARPGDAVDRSKPSPPGP